MMFCTQCGKQNPGQARFCFACGSQLILPPRAPFGQSVDGGDGHDSEGRNASTNAALSRWWKGRSKTWWVGAVTGFLVVVIALTFVGMAFDLGFYGSGWAVIGIFGGGWIAERIASRLSDGHGTASTVFLEPFADRSPLGLSRRAERTLINLAAGLAVLSATTTAVASLAGTFGMTELNLIDAAVFAALAFGVLRRSRIAALGLFGFYLVQRVWWLGNTGQLSASFGFVPMLYAVVYLLGVFATVSHHGRYKITTR